MRRSQGTFSSSASIYNILSHHCWSISIWAFKTFQYLSWILNICIFMKLPTCSLLILEWPQISMGGILQSGLLVWRRVPRIEYFERCAFSKYWHASSACVMHVNVHMTMWKHRSRSGSESFLWTSDWFHGTRYTTRTTPQGCFFIWFEPRLAITCFKIPNHFSVWDVKYCKECHCFKKWTGAKMVLQTFLDAMFPCWVSLWCCCDVHVGSVPSTIAARLYTVTGHAWTRPSLLQT